jgi:hypothetical protein
VSIADALDLVDEAISATREQFITEALASGVPPDEVAEAHLNRDLPEVHPSRLSRLLTRDFGTAPDAVGS